jgi:hypothetical protein
MSIINAEARQRLKTPDWLGEQIAKVCMTDAGFDYKALLKLAEENGADVKAYWPDVKSGEFNKGMMRMNVRNRIQKKVIENGKLVVGGKGKKFPPDWLDDKGRVKRG